MVPQLMLRLGNACTTMCQYETVQENLQKEVTSHTLCLIYGVMSG